MQSPLADAAKKAVQRFITGPTSSQIEKGTRFSSLFEIESVLSKRSLNRRGSSGVSTNTITEFLTAVVSHQHELKTSNGDKVSFYIGYSGLSLSHLSVPYERLFAYSCDEQSDQLFLTVVDENMIRRDYVLKLNKSINNTNTAPKRKHSQTQEVTVQDLVQGISLRIANKLAQSKGLSQSDAQRLVFQCASPEVFASRADEVLSPFSLAGDRKRSSAEEERDDDDSRTSQPEPDVAPKQSPRKKSSLKSLMSPASLMRKTVTIKI